MGVVIDNGQDEPAWVEPFYRWAKTDKSPGSYSAAYAAGWAAALAARPSADTETLHEWQCPSCGATTRARMADSPRPEGPR